jgi:predicted nucleic acid-binding protein
VSIYADTNFLSRLYLERPETSEAEALFKRAKPLLPVTWLLRVELTNAFEQSVFTGYGESQARISTEFAAACHQQFRDDQKDRVFLKPVDVPPNDLGRLFEEIALRHTARHGFRTYDILHVASALLLKCRTFWSFDARASKLAKLEGLKTL